MRSTSEEARYLVLQNENRFVDREHKDPTGDEAGSILNDDTVLPSRRSKDSVFFSVSSGEDMVPAYNLDSRLQGNRIHEVCTDNTLWQRDRCPDMRYRNSRRIRRDDAFTRTYPPRVVRLPALDCP